MGHGWGKSRTGDDRECSYVNHGDRETRKTQKDKHLHFGYDDPEEALGLQVRARASDKYRSNKITEHSVHN